ncbi:MAG: XRE family transcriptional regulator [Pseudomonadota bacterium]
MKKSYVKSGTKDVWNFLGIPEDESPELRLRVMIYEKILQEIKAEDLTARELEKILDEQQPRVSNLLSGKLEKFSSDKLFQYLVKISPKKQFYIHEELRINPKRKAS